MHRSSLLSGAQLLIITGSPMGNYSMGWRSALQLPDHSCSSPHLSVISRAVFPARLWRHSLFLCRHLFLCSPVCITLSGCATTVISRRFLPVSVPQLSE